MNFEEYLKQAKEQIRNTEIVTYEKPNKKKEVYEEANDYYSIPNTKEGFKGDVIELNGEEFNLFFQKYSNGLTEYRFRDKLERMDNWLSDKPYKVTQNWINYIPQWLQNNLK